MFTLQLFENYVVNVVGCLWVADFLKLEDDKKKEFMEGIFEFCSKWASLIGNSALDNKTYSGRYSHPRVQFIRETEGRLRQALSKVIKIKDKTENKTEKEEKEDKAVGWIEHLLRNLLYVKVDFKTYGISDTKLDAMKTFIPFAHVSQSWEKEK